MRGSVRAAVTGAALVAAWMVAAFAVAAPVPVEPKTAQPAQFMSSANCGCHAALVEEWSQSMHSQALVDKIYLTKVDEASKATNGVLGPFCKKCHGPAAAMMGEFLPGAKLSETGGEGISCMFCHQVTGLKDDKPANTSQLVDLSGIRRAQIKDPAAPHPATYSAFHESAEICGGCHNVNHPVNGMHLEATYAEWKASPWAAEGVVCQDCHMSGGPDQVGPFSGQAAGGAPTRDNMYKMSFIGANVAQGPAEESATRLKSAAEMTVALPDVVSPGTAASVTVNITNKGAGHKLPTGLTEVRQMWLEVYMTGADGAKVAVGEHQFGTILQDASGKAPVELWDATAIKSDDRIGPRETFTESFTLTMPQGADEAQLVAVLNYKSAPDELAEKAGVENPTTEMVKVEQAVYGSAEAKAAAAEPDKPSGGSDIGNVVVVAVGLLAIIGLVTFFLMRSRKIAG